MNKEHRKALEDMHDKIACFRGGEISMARFILLIIEILLAQDSPETTLDKRSSTTAES